MKAVSPLRKLSVRGIDLESARAHFDLPVDGQFASRRDMLSALEGVRLELEIPVRRHGAHSGLQRNSR